MSVFLKATIGEILFSAKQIFDTQSITSSVSNYSRVALQQTFIIGSSAMFLINCLE